MSVATLSLTDRNRSVLFRTSTKKGKKRSTFSEEFIFKKVQIRFFVLKEVCSLNICSSANRRSPVPKFFEEEKKKKKASSAITLAFNLLTLQNQAGWKHRDRELFALADFFSGLSSRTENYYVVHIMLRELFSPPGMVK